jgi:hypothetical protein
MSSEGFGKTSRVRAFSSACEFLAYAQDRYALPMSLSKQNIDFQAKHEEIARWVGQDQELAKIAKSGGVFAGHHVIVEALWDTVRSAIPPEIWAPFSSRVAVGCLEHMQVNAACICSPEGWIAILVNNGLLTFLNKLFKLTAVAHEPDAVLYCNRGDAGLFGSGDYAAWATEMTAYYAVHREPLGPQLVLKPESDAAKRYALMLHFSEVFVLGHEIGHVVLGHLDRGTPEERELRADPEGIVSIKEGEAWHDEADADMIAWSVILSLFSKRGADDRFLVSQLAGLMNVLHGIHRDTRTTHPPPISRLLEIVARFYGEDSATRLLRTYQDQGTMNEFFSSPLIVMEGQQSGRI